MLPLDSPASHVYPQTLRIRDLPSFATAGGIPALMSVHITESFLPVGGVGLIQAKALCGCKRDGEPSGGCRLLSPTILGQVYDQLALFSSTARLLHPLCILTCINHSYIVALDPKEAGDSSMIVDSMFGAENIECLKELFDPVEDPAEDDSRDGDVVETPRRRLVVSQAFAANAVGEASLASFFLTTFIKMVYCRALEDVKLEHGDTFEGRALRVHASDQDSWVLLPATKLNFERMPDPSSDELFCIQFLHAFTSDRTALVCNADGDVGLLKFYSGKLSRGLDISRPEYSRRMWCEVYHDEPDLTSHVHTVMLREPFCVDEEAKDALLLPFLRPLTVDEKLSCIDKVEVCLRRFSDADYKHNNVAWFNIGMYKKETGEELVVVYDMLRVETWVAGDVDDEGKPEWIASSMRQLPDLKF